MKLKIKKIHKDAIIPKYVREGDAGMDLYSVEGWILKPGERKLFKTGIGTEIEEGYVGLIQDRSGLAFKNGITVLGGVIDHTYRGEYGVILLNTSQTERYAINKGDRIAQLLIMPIATAKIEEVEELTQTNRGKGGFGSSGKK